MSSAFSLLLLQLRLVKAVQRARSRDSSRLGSHRRVARSEHSVTFSDESLFPWQ